MNYEELSDFEINKAVARFDEKWTLSDSGCWEWSHSTNKLGYGCFWFVDRTHQAHRVSYRLFKGPFNSALLVCHTCDNPSCVNPDHLFLGTNQDNCDDKIRKGRSADTRGDKNPRSKIRSTDLGRIRYRLKKGDTCAHIAAYYGVHETTISRIKLGRTWRES